LSLWAKSLSVAIQLKANEQQLPCGNVYYAVQGGSTFAPVIESQSVTENVVYLRW